MNQGITGGKHVLPAGDQAALKTLTFGGAELTSKVCPETHSAPFIARTAPDPDFDCQLVPPRLKYEFPNKRGRSCMGFTLNTRKVNDVVVVDMSGQLGGGEPVLLLRNTVRHFMEDGSRKFVLNLGQVSYVDSSGLGELVITYTSARNRQGDIKLLNLSRIAKDLLQVTKLLTVFDVFDDESKAIQSLANIKPATTNS
jgi:anti-sigma B factor antagonist